MKNILDVTKNLNFTKEVVLPSSKKKVTFRPMVIKDAQGLGVNGMDQLTKGKFKTKNEFLNIYKEFESVLDNTILMVSDIKDKSELSELCFLDYVVLFSEIRSKSEGQDELILSNRCNVTIKENVDEETGKTTKIPCNDVVRVGLSLSDMKVINDFEGNTILDCELKNEDKIKYSFNIKKLSFHNYMKFLFLTNNKIKMSENETLDILIGILFDTTDTIKVAVDKIEYNFKLLKDIKKEINDQDVDLKTFTELLSNELPQYLLSSLFKNLLASQPQIHGEIKYNCSRNHEEKMEVTTFDFFTLI